MNNLLHPEFCTPMGALGSHYLQLLEARESEVAAATAGLNDPDVSVVIRARNERERLGGLLEDIANQQFAGEVQLLVVDSGSTDGTRELAREHGAQVVHIDQDTYSHPKALNLGFEAADFDHVITLVGHSNLVSRLTFAGLTRWAGQKDFAGVYGPAALPDNYATCWERWLAAGMKLQNRLGPAEPVSDLQRGIMITHRAAFAKEAWHSLGGFDLRYGAGGEDRDMARRMLEAGMTVVREPLLSIYHSHALGLVGTIRQALEYRRLRVSGPTDFDAGRLGYRRALRLDQA